MVSDQNQIATILRARASGNWSDNLLHIPEALLAGADEIDRLEARIADLVEKRVQEAGHE